MEKITKEDILNHPLLKESLNVTRSVSKGISGYVCHEMIHVLYVLKEMMGEDCKTYLEIGTHNGGSMMTVMQSKHNTKFFGVDVWWQDSNRVMAQQNIAKKNINNHEFTLIKGNAMSDDTLEKVKKICTEIDFLFIDGGHTYENVINDFEKYSGMVTKNGLIVFDDYLMFERPNPYNAVEKKRKGQVRLAVDDLVKKYGDDYNVIGILPNDAGAFSKANLDYNVSFIMQKIK